MWGGDKHMKKFENPPKRRTGVETKLVKLCIKTLYGKQDRLAIEKLYKIRYNHLPVIT